MIDVQSVTERLKSLGYIVKSADAFALKFCIEKVRNTIMNDTNLSDVPPGLDYIATDMVAGEFLLSKKTFSPADLTGFDFDYAVKQIQDGDTNVVFAVGSGNLTPEQRLDAFINYLLMYGKSQFSAFRKIKW